MKDGKRLRRWSLLASAFLGLAILVGGVQWLNSADHTDNPGSSEANLDILDFYAFSTSGGDNLALVITVSGFLASGEQTNNAAFNPNALYQFKFSDARDGVPDAVMQVHFTGSGTSQTVNVRALSAPSVTTATGQVFEGTVIASGAFNTTFTGGGVTAFAGPRDDPFFLDLTGDMSLTSVLNAVFGAALGTTIGSPTEQTLAFSNPGTDSLAGLNALAIVVEVPKADIAEALGVASDATIYAWATTDEETS